MSELTQEWLAELRRVAEAATPGPWAVNPWQAVVDEMETLTPICGMLWPTELRTEEQTLANAQHIAAFDPPTVLALLDEIKRLTTRVAQLEESHDWWRTEANRRLRERAAILDILGREEMGAETKMEGVRLILNKTKGGDGP